MITDEELNYWCAEFPELERREIEEILEAVELDKTNTQGVKNAHTNNGP